MAPNELSPQSSVLATRNLLVRGTNWVGDSIITIPAFRELRRMFPAARISVLARPWVTGIFEDSGLVDDILTYDSRTESFLTCVKKIKAQKFDTAILFQNAFEAAALAFCARIPRRVGFPTDGRRFLLTDAIPLEKATLRKHQLFYYLDLLARYEERLTGITQVNHQNPDYRLPVAEPRRLAIRTRLRDEFGISTEKQWIAVCPGATNSMAKRWPVEYFAQLIDRLLARPDLEVMLIGAANELDVSQAVLAQATQKNRIRLLTGKTSLAESIAFLTWCDLVISNDTGPAYLTGALDRPLLTIFGPTDSTMICPYSNHAHIIRKLVHCAPCMLRECPIDHRCMRNLLPEEVLHRALELLN
ncbi:MAG: lipopolysaccharide heptosyltransferase II [Blastocatellia bacterium]|nr:lipopolysaccharide heptosyltransferase II [Blastocatellia bacterium]